MTDVETAAQLWFARCQLEPLGAGHIHDTYRVDVEGERFVLQKVNEFVFKDGSLLITQAARTLAQLGGDYPFVAPRLHESRAGNLSERVDGVLWRVWDYIPDTQVIDPVRSPMQARAAGHAFGTFQRYLAAMPEPRFVDPIAGFMQFDEYLQAFHAVADAAEDGDRARVEALAGLAGDFASRNTYIHGDCKVNNLLFDKAGESVAAVIDIDTVMFGHWAWDFGDLMRSIAMGVSSVETEYFKATVDGFLAGSERTNTTARDFALAPAYVAAMLGVRFLTDHLSGDPYFKVAVRGDNLVRAREQFDLAEAFVDNARELENTAAELIDAA